MGNLFYRGATPTEIESMGWVSIMYWDDWCQTMRRQEAKPQGSALFSSSSAGHFRLRRPWRPRGA